MSGTKIVEPATVTAICDLSNLSALKYANGFTLWQYRHDLDRSDGEPLGAGFFDPAADMLRPGDLLMVSMLAAEPQESALAVDVAHGALAIVHRTKPHVILQRIEG